MSNSQCLECANICKATHLRKRCSLFEMTLLITRICKDEVEVKILKKDIFFLVKIADFKKKIPLRYGQEFSSNDLRKRIKKAGEK